MTRIRMPDGIIVEWLPSLAEAVAEGQRQYLNFAGAFRHVRHNLVVQGQNGFTVIGERQPSHKPASRDGSLVRLYEENVTVVARVADRPF